MDWTAFLLSIKLALATVAVLLPLSVFLAKVISGLQTAVKPWFEALVMLPLVLPPTVMGFYLLLAFSPQSGFGRWLSDTFGLNLAFEFSGLLVASILFNLPFMVQPIQRALEAIPKDLIEASKVCGLNRRQCFFQVELPLAWTGLATGMLLTFVHTLGEFGVVLMIGGSIPGQTQTLSIAIYDSVQSFDMDGANQMAFALLTFSIISVVVTYLLANRYRRVKA